MRTLLIIAACGLLVLLLGQWLKKVPAEDRARTFGSIALFALGGVLVLLTIAGKAHWLFGLAGAVMPFAQKISTGLKAFRFLQRLKGHGRDSGAESPRVSTIQTRFLSVQMDPASGVMTGRVLQGIFKGYSLHKMPFEHLTRLLRELRIEGDVDSIRLLESYLDHHWKNEWNEYLAQRNRHQDSRTGTADLSIEEAYQMLGLPLGASQEEIRAAHRRLMQRLHPDRGGSDYLATRINRAKDTLLKHLKKAS